MIDIILPISFVASTLLVYKYSLSISFTIFPFSLIDVFVFMGKPAFAFKFTMFSHPLIFGSILEFNRT